RRDEPSDPLALLLGLLLAGRLLRSRRLLRRRLLLGLRLRLRLLRGGALRLLGRLCGLGLRLGRLGRGRRRRRAPQAAARRGDRRVAGSEREGDVAGALLDPGDAAAGAGAEALQRGALVDRGGLDDQLVADEAVVCLGVR